MKGFMHNGPWSHIHVAQSRLMNPYPLGAGRAVRAACPDLEATIVSWLPRGGSNVRSTCRQESFGQIIRRPEPA